DVEDPLVEAFQDAYMASGVALAPRGESGASATGAGKPLPIGAKPFCDDGNSFWSHAKVPAITHGPNAGGAHTPNDGVSIDDLVRVAVVYALTAIAYCPS